MLWAQFRELRVRDCLCPGFLQLGAIKVTSFENGNGDLECADFIACKLELFMAVGRGKRGVDLCLGGLNLRMRTKNNPRPALGATDA